MVVARSILDIGKCFAQTELKTGQPCLHPKPILRTMRPMEFIQWHELLALVPNLHELLVSIVPINAYLYQKPLGGFEKVCNNFVIAIA